MKALGLFMILALSGCGSIRCCPTIMFQNNVESLNYLIIGVGIVTVPKPDVDTAVLATKFQALGVSVSDQPGMKLAIGYTSSSVVAIPDNAADVRVDVSQKLGGPLTIHTQKATLNGDHR